jgi:hypothetical protein
LDFLRKERGARSDRLGSSEWRAMQWHYLRDVVRQKQAQKRRHAERRRQAQPARAAGERL